MNSDIWRMEMKHVAYIRSGSIYTDSRATKEIKALLEAGYKVTVIGWDRTGIAEENCKKVFNYDKQWLSFDFFSLNIRSERGIKNSTKFLSWLKYVYRTLKEIQPLDAVHACNLDGGYAAYMFCKRYRCKLIYDIYDYYIDSHSIPGLLIDFIEKCEIKVINYADCTIICTEERKEQISKSSPKKLIVLHNSPEVVMDTQSEEEVYDYSYCGSLTDRRLICEIVEKYSEHTDLKFCFAGNGKYSQNVFKIGELFDSFSFKDAIPYNEVLEIELKTKVLSAIYEPTIRNHRLCAPNKFYESLALGKPVIVCRGTGIDEVVERNQIGIVIDYDADQFYDALIVLCQDYGKRNDMGKRARQLYEKQYNWNIMKHRLVETYNSLIN
jgi:glycosyltransferase involved in cell wall biosynthesis